MTGLTMTLCVRLLMREAVDETRRRIECLLHCSDACVDLLNQYYRGYTSQMSSSKYGC